MYDKIWYEFTHAKYGEEYLSLYISLQYNLKKAFEIIVLVFSTSGVLGWELWKPIAWIALILLSLIQIFSLISTKILRTDKEIEKISKLRQMYVSYFNELEKLWIDLKDDVIDSNAAKKEFYNLRKSIKEPIESLDNEIGIKKWKRLKRKADEETRIYLLTYHK